MTEDSARFESEAQHDEAQELLMEAVSNIAAVQNDYDVLNEEQMDYLEDAKSSIAAVSVDLEGVEFDL